MHRSIEPLQPGDLIRLISPAGPTDLDNLSSGVSNLESWGYKVDLGRSALTKNDYLAGADEDRLNDLVEALLDPSVRGIICTRGGYGSARLLEGFPWELMNSISPKLFVGFSDVSALMLNFWDRLRWKSYFGLQVANGLDGHYTDRSVAHFRNCLENRNTYIGWLRNQDLVLQSIKEGSCEGVMIPCCLSILVSLIGTAFFPELNDAVLCIEDLNEPLYKYDRMLTQLRMSGMMDNINGLILGRFIYKNEDVSDRVSNIAKDVFIDYEFPIWYGMPFGHYDDRITLAIGDNVRINSQGKISTVKRKVLDV